MAVKKTDSARMGEMPEGRLLLSIAVPIMLSMLVQALYNIIDSVYVSHVSQEGLSALTLAFPAQNIMIGLGTGTGVGVSALISRALGSKDGSAAGRIAGTGLFLGVCYWVLMFLFGLFGTEAFINPQTADPVVRENAYIYLRIITMGSLFLYIEMLCERMLQATGRTNLSMWTQMAGAITNIILDPFFIYGWCGLPAMGTAGAATATVIGQGVAAGLGLFFQFRKNPEVRILRNDFIPRIRIIGGILRIGLPSILMVSIGSITNYVMNIILDSFSQTAVAVYGAYFKIQSFFFMPVYGLNSGIIPVIGYNYGAGNRDRIYRTIRYGVLYAAAIMAAGTLLFQLIPHLILAIFKPSAHMLEIGIPALRIISISFLPAAFCIVTGSACQAMDRSIFSFLTSVLRQLVVLVPAAYLLSLTGAVQNVWWAFPIAEVISLIASVFFLRAVLKHMEAQLARRAAQRAAQEG
ncbi:MAG: MATE family efflux transporter [Lachnospiraceae bacterium]|nr:MATE family efflux transporter [Lachnospiraceae bacterium]